jgi:hypothetical protein
MKINKKYQCSNFFLCQKLKSRVSFIQLKPPSTQSESPLAPKSHASFKVCTQLWTEFFKLQSGLTVTGLARVYCSLFNKTANNSDYNPTMMGWLMNSKRCGGKWPWPILRYCPGISLGEMTRHLPHTSQQHSTLSTWGLRFPLRLSGHATSRHGVVCCVATSGLEDTHILHLQGTLKTS